MLILLTLFPSVLCRTTEHLDMSGWAEYYLLRWKVGSQSPGIPHCCPQPPPHRPPTPASHLVQWVPWLWAMCEIVPGYGLTQQSWNLHTHTEVNLGFIPNWNWSLVWAGVLETGWKSRLEFSFWILILGSACTRIILQNADEEKMALCLFRAFSGPQIDHELPLSLPLPQLLCSLQISLHPPPLAQFYIWNLLWETPLSSYLIYRILPGPLVTNCNFIPFLNNVPLFLSLLWYISYCISLLFLS